MSSAQNTMAATIKATGPTQLASLAAAEAAKQATLDAATNVVNYRPGTGGAGEAAYQAAIATAKINLANSRAAAEQAKQAAVAVAKDTLRAATGEIPF